MYQALADVINLERNPLESDSFRRKCKQTLDENGVLVIPSFLKPLVISSLQREGQENKHLAYYAVKNHNIYLTESDPKYPQAHPRNRLYVLSMMHLNFVRFYVRCLMNKRYTNTQIRYHQSISIMLMKGRR